MSIYHLLIAHTIHTLSGVSVLLVKLLNQKMFHTPEKEKKMESFVILTKAKLDDSSFFLLACVEGNILFTRRTLASSMNASTLRKSSKFYCPEVRKENDSDRTNTDGCNDHIVWKLRTQEIIEFLTGSRPQYLRS